MEWQERAEALKASFTPAAPVRHHELFAGRQEQLIRVVDSIGAPGEHAAIFGERGVGKTSLATISEAVARIRGLVAARINCTANDLDIAAVARRIGEALDRHLRIARVTADPDVDLARLEGVVPGAVALLTGPSVNAHELLTALDMLTIAGGVVVFLDEFDRLAQSTVHTDIVDLMKTISDQGLPITIVVVGVAADVDNLIDEHESIGRGLNEIKMPRMSISELREILDRGLAPAEMTITEEAADFIAHLSIGLPHYTHLMGLHSGLNTVGEASTIVDVGNVVQALSVAVERAQQHVQRLYHEATHSTQANLFREILLAASLTPTDDNGFFAPGDVRQPIEIVCKRRMEIPSFSKQLSSFAETRGPVLERSGQVRRRPRYRFTEPLLVPYVSMRGVAEGVITQEQLRRLLLGS